MQSKKVYITYEDFVLNFDPNNLQRPARILKSWKTTVKYIIFVFISKLTSAKTFESFFLFISIFLLVNFRGSRMRFRRGSKFDYPGRIIDL